MAAMAAMAAMTKKGFAATGGVGKRHCEICGDCDCEKDLRAKGGGVCAAAERFV